MIIMNEEITKDPDDDNVRRIYKRQLPIIMNKEITEDAYDNNERRNYKRPL